MQLREQTQLSKRVVTVQTLRQETVHSDTKQYKCFVTKRKIFVLCVIRLCLSRSCSAVKKWFSQSDVKEVDVPAQSSHLKPIQHL